MMKRLLQIESPMPWGLKDIENLVRADWKAVRAFVEKHIPRISQAVRDRSWDDGLCFLPWSDLATVLSEGYRYVQRREASEADYERAMARRVAWSNLLRWDTGIADPGNWHKADERLALAAKAVLATETVRGAVERIMRRSLTAAEESICPDRGFSDLDRSRASLCLACGHSRLGLRRYLWCSVQLDLRYACATYHRILEAFGKDQLPQDDDMYHLHAYATELTGPYLYEAPTANGAVFYVMRTMLVEPEELPENIAPALAGPAALDVMKNIEDYFRVHGPMFVVECHNPQCGRRFFTAHNAVVSCPRAPRSGRRSPCKSAWDAYRKWLLKHQPNENPERIWNSQKLKSRFIAQYKPRSKQAHLI